MCSSRLVRIRIIFSTAAGNLRLAEQEIVAL